MWPKWFWKNKYIRINFLIWLPNGFKGSGFNEIINSDLEGSIESFGVHALFRTGNQTSRVGLGLKENSYNYKKIFSFDGKNLTKRMMKIF